MIILRQKQYTRAEKEAFKELWEAFKGWNSKYGAKETARLTKFAESFDPYQIGKYMNSKEAEEFFKSIGAKKMADPKLRAKIGNKYSIEVRMGKKNWEHVMHPASTRYYKIIHNLPLKEKEKIIKNYLLKKGSSIIKAAKGVPEYAEAIDTGGILDSGSKKFKKLNKQIKELLPENVNFIKNKKGKSFFMPYSDRGEIISYPKNPRHGNIMAHEYGHYLDYLKKNGKKFIDGPSHSNLQTSLKNFAIEARANSRAKSVLKKLGYSPKTIEKYNRGADKAMETYRGNLISEANMYHYDRAKKAVGNLHNPDLYRATERPDEILENAGRRIIKNIHANNVKNRII